MNPISPQDLARIVLVMFLWAICFPLITAGISLAPHLYFAATRASVAGASLLILAFLLHRPLPRGLRTWGFLLMIGGGATTLGFLGMFHAAEFVTPGVATVLANTQPLLAAVLAHFWLQEVLGIRAKWGLVLAFFGIILISVPQFLSTTGNSYPVGIAYILLAAFGITISNVLIRYLAGRVDILMAMGFQLLFGAIPLWWATWYGETLPPNLWSWRFSVILLLLALPGTALVYYLWCTVLEKVALNQANAFSFLIPVFGLTLGIVLFGETLGWLEIGGIGLTLLGISQVISQRQNRPSVTCPVEK